MAHIKNYYRCPTCKSAYDTEKDATICKNKHPVNVERWAIGKGGKAVRIFDNCSPDGVGGERYALQEADMSDNIKERKRQMEELEKLRM